jgi:hypothetical protein
MVLFGIRTDTSGHGHERGSPRRAQKGLNALLGFPAIELFQVELGDVLIHFLFLFCQCKDIII